MGRRGKQEESMVVVVYGRQGTAALTDWLGLQASTSRTGARAGSSSSLTARSAGGSLRSSPSFSFSLIVFSSSSSASALSCTARYRTGPPAPGDGPINFFDVAGSVLTKTDDKKSKKYGFTIRFMQMTRFVERSFHLDSPEERDEWVKAYSDVKKQIMATNNVEHSNTAEPKPENTASNADQKEISINDFEMLKVLGKGTFGKVGGTREKRRREEGGRGGGGE